MKNDDDEIFLSHFFTHVPEEWARENEENWPVIPQMTLHLCKF
jgi:hypothetical protein